MKALVRALVLSLGFCLSGASLAAQPMAAAGGRHTLVLRNDGTVLAFGDDALGQLGVGATAQSGMPVQASGMSSVTAVAAGGAHTLALRTDGSVWAWGDNSNGQLGVGTASVVDRPVQALGLSGITDLAAGFIHSVALKADGSVWAWGSNYKGELGDGTQIFSTTPRQVPGLTGIRSIAAGYQYTAALGNDGRVRTWGNNSSGQLGDGTTNNRATPSTVTGLSGVAAIATGWSHVLALKSDGTVWTWGSNLYGQLGDGTTTDRSIPAQVTGLTEVTAIAAGIGHSIAVKADGSVWTWGAYSYGSDGTVGYRSSPARAEGFAVAVSAVSAGFTHSLAIGADGSLWGLGSNMANQLGSAASDDPTVPIRIVPELGPVRSASASMMHSVALKLDGTVWSWGSNGFSQFGNAAENDGSSVPAAPTGLSDIAHIATGWANSLAVKSDGTVWAWGGHMFVPLLADRWASGVPVQVAGLSGVTAVAAGQSFSMALKADGSVWAWGGNNSGQLGDGTTIDHTVPKRVWGLSGITAIAAGWEFGLALGSDGSVWGWGNSESGQLGAIPQQTCRNIAEGDRICSPTATQIPGLSSIVALAAGEVHGLALKSDGTVWAWGDNGSGQLGNDSQNGSSTPTQIAGLSGVMAISANSQYSVALKSDGTVWVWGDNRYGQLGDGTTTGLGEGTSTGTRVPTQVPGLTDIVAIVAGGTAGVGSHVVAVKSDGTVWAWGENLYGQLGDGTYVSRPTPTLAANATADGPLDLIAESTNAIPADKLPAFYLAAAKSGGLSATTLSATLRGGTATRSIARSTGNYKVFVAALTAGQFSGWFQLDANHSWSMLSWPMAEFMTGVDLGSQTTQLVVDILDDANLVSLGGTTFYLGYGTSADEMLAAGRYRDIYAVPAQ
jgi:alpha-tubulin suppressor-like RCC1 family protein